MDRVADRLFVGTAADATSLDDGVTAVVSLTHDVPTVDPEAAVVSVPLVDGPQCDATAFGRAVDETHDLLTAGETVLVHCAAGASRSPSVAATALALHSGQGLDAAFEQVADARAAVDPHPALVDRAATAYVDRRSP
ncbi:dual specificity protein phosphatase family protein [Halorarius litoreus]|uniref:dual specificity protein phosphatase family protein n=1 Tax=Halorarius litoreus TaxID=2962676 RepID=UPI0020CCBD89|nr:dual specificity protein phosphatase [Halorarius litoreus]